MRTRGAMARVVAFLALLCLGAEWSRGALAAELGEEPTKEPAKEGKEGGEKQAAEALKIDVHKDALVAGIRRLGQVAVGECFEVWRRPGPKSLLIGYAQAVELVENYPKLRFLLGGGREGDELVRVASPMPGVELLTDEPLGAEARELKALCGGKLKVVAIEEKMRKPMKDEILVALIHGGVPFMLGDPIVEPHAREGGTVLCDTLLYAQLKGLETKQEKFPKAPSLRIINPGPLTAGFTNEDRLPWYGKSGKDFVARYWPALFKPTDPQKPLATDETTRNTAFFEEDLGGRMLVLDLVSPNGRAGRDPGSKNKWLFLARALGTGPRYARYRASRPELDDLLGWFDAAAKENKDRVAKTFEGGGASKEEFLHSYTLGPQDKPLVLLVAGFEGNDWIAPWALITLFETLLNNPQGDPTIEWLLPRLRIKIIPVLNLYGYRKDTPVSARKVELNRNFPYHWEEYADKKGRGKEPFSEPETALLKRIVEEEKPVAFLELDADDYDSGYRIVRARDLTETQHELVRTFRTILNARLTGRAIVNGDQPLQLRLLRDAERPSAINWVGSKGVLAASLKVCGDGEDSLVNGDVAIEGCLTFLAATALSLEKPPTAGTRPAGP